MTAFHFNNANFAGYVFSDFYARKDPAPRHARWYVYGRNGEKYGHLPDGKGAYIKRCAWPTEKNGLARGWSNKRAAQEVADWLNRADWTVEASHSLD